MSKTRDRDPQGSVARTVLHIQQHGGARSRDGTQATGQQIADRVRDSFAKADRKKSG